MFIVLILFLLSRIVLLTIEILRGWGRGERLPLCPLLPSTLCMKVLNWSYVQNLHFIQLGQFRFLKLC